MRGGIWSEEGAAPNSAAGMRTTRFGKTFAVGVTRTRPVREAVHEARRGTQIAGLVGLVARGVLYLVLAVLALGLVFGKRRGNEVDARGAMEELARHGFGSVLLVILTIGFASFAVVVCVRSAHANAS